MRLFSFLVVLRVTGALHSFKTPLGPQLSLEPPFPIFSEMSHKTQHVSPSSPTTHIQFYLVLHLSLRGGPLSPLRQRQ